MKIKKHATQSAIDAQIESCYQTKLMHGYGDLRAIIVMQENGSLGFRFSNDRNVGDILSFDNGNSYLVVAVV